MPKPPKPMNDLDQSKAGLQDDHDPRDIGQKQNDVPEEIKDKQHGVQNPPKEDPTRGAEEAARSAILRGTVPRNLFHPGMIRTLRDYEYWCHTQKGGHRTLYFLGHEHITRAAYIAPSVRPTANHISFMGEREWRRRGRKLLDVSSSAPAGTSGMSGEALRADSRKATTWGGLWRQTGVGNPRPEPSPGRGTRVIGRAGRSNARQAKAISCPANALQAPSA